MGVERHHDFRRRTAAGPASAAPHQKRTSARIMRPPAKVARSSTLSGRNGIIGNTTQSGKDTTINTIPEEVIHCFRRTVVFGDSSMLRITANVRLTRRSSRKRRLILVNIEFTSSMKWRSRDFLRDGKLNRICD